MHLLTWGRRTRLVPVYMCNPLHVSGAPAFETCRSTRPSLVDDQQCSRSHTKTCMLALRIPHVDKNIEWSIKARPLLAGTWRCSVGARKLPHEGPSDGGLVSRLPLTYEYIHLYIFCLLYTSPSPRDKRQSRMPSSA